MVRALASVLLLPTLAACSASDRFILFGPDVEGLTWGAAIATLVGGETRGSGFSRLQESRFEVGIELGESDVESLTFVGYAEGVLESADLPNADTLRDTPIRFAQATDSWLPTASYMGEGVPENGRAFSSPIDPPRNISASWLPTCPGPDLSQSFEVHTNCDARFCPIPSRNIGTCGLLVDLQLCTGLPALQGTRDGQGMIQFESVATLGDCATRREPAAGAAISIDCSGTASQRACSVHLYPEQLEPIADDIREVAVLDVPEMLDANPDAGIPELGYFGGLAALGDRVVVSSFDGAYARRACPGRLDSRIHIYDGEDLSLIDTATAGSCLRHIRGLRGGTFIALFDGPRAGRHVLGEFDRDGKLIRSQALDHPFLESLRLQAPELTVLEDAPEPIVVVGLAGVVAGEAGYLEAIRLSDFSRLWAEPREVSREIDALFVGPGGDTIGMLDGGDDLVELYGLDQALVHAIDFKIQCAVMNLSPISGMWDPRDDLIVAVARDSRPSAYVFDNATDTCEDVPFFPFAGRPVIVHPWPSDEHRAVVSIEPEDPSDKTAFISLLAAREARYAPPALAVGRGLVRDMDIDAQGRVWMVLGDTGKLVRVTPRP